MAKVDTSWGGPNTKMPETVADLIHRAADPSAETRRAALEVLCHCYWKPSYHYIRKAWRKSNDDAKDLTQAFFLWLTEENVIANYASEKAGFRTFFKLLLKRFVQDEERARERLKRGGGMRLVELNASPESLGRLLEDPRAVDPEKAFDLSLWEALLERAVRRVRERLLDSGHSVRLNVYEAYDLSPPSERPTYSALGVKLGLSENDVLHHLAAAREEIRAEIRAELAQMTSSPEELEEEWRSFFRA